MFIVKNRCVQNLKQFCTHLAHPLKPYPNCRAFPTKNTIHPGGVFCWYGYLEGGFERRLLATVRWTVATAVAFPQKSESTFPHQKRNLFCLSDKRGFFSTKSILCRIWRLQHMHEAAFVGQKFIGKCEIVRTGLRCVDDQFVRDLSRLAAHNIDAVGKQNRFVDIMRDEQR